MSLWIMAAVAVACAFWAGRTMARYRRLEAKSWQLAEVTLRLAAEVTALRDRVQAMRDAAPAEGWRSITPPNLIGDFDVPVDIRA